MTTMQMLDVIEEAKCIYDIHYARAGVGFKFYYPEQDKGDTDESWRNALSVDRYYPTFREAVKGEYDRLHHRDAHQFSLRSRSNANG